MQSFIRLPFMSFLMLIFCEIYDYFRFISEFKKSEIATKIGMKEYDSHPRPLFAENYSFSSQLNATLCHLMAT